MPNEHVNPSTAHHEAPVGAPHHPNEPGHAGGHELPFHVEGPQPAHPEHPMEPGELGPHDLDIPPADPIDFGVFDPPHTVLLSPQDPALLERLHSLPLELQIGILEKLDTASLVSVIKSDQVPESLNLLVREAYNGNLISLTGRKVSIIDGVLKEVGGAVVAPAADGLGIFEMVRRKQLLRERDIIEAPPGLVRQAGDVIFDMWLEGVTNALASRDDFTPEEQLQIIILNASSDTHYEGLPGFAAAPQEVVRELVHAQELVWIEDGRTVDFADIPAANDQSRAIFILAKMALREVGRVARPDA